MSEAVYRGDADAFRVFLDWLEEENPLGDLLQVGEAYYVLTPLFHYVGRVARITPMGVTFHPGGTQIHLLNDLATFLAIGRLAPGDEVVPVPMEFSVPTLWVGPPFRWPHSLNFPRTHPSVTE